MSDLAVLTTENAIEALATCLETMAFISLAPADEPFGVPSNPVLAEIEFDGPAKGTLYLCTSSALGVAVASAVTGEVTPSITSHDALKEVMNMLAGSLLRHETLPPGFSISLPWVRSNLTDEEWECFVRDPNTTVVDAEGVIVGLKISLTRQSKSCNHVVSA